MAWLVIKYLITAAIVVLATEVARRSDKLGALVLPALLPRFGFWPTLLACLIITIVCFGLFALIVRRIGVDLL